MLIGNRYADNKMYRGIKHYNNLPLTSGDLHEYADILQMKNAYLLNNLLGAGTLNVPAISISSTGISLQSPSVILIDGDISLIQSDDELITISEIDSSDISEGLLCIVGWYQSLTANSTLRSYGGVRNNIIENDIIDTDLNIQVSTRYQLRWDIVLIDKTTYESNNPININISNRDSTGSLTTGTTSITANIKINNIRVATKPNTMDYAVSDLYVVPILSYSYNGSIITSAKAIKPLETAGGSVSLIKSSTQPTGDLEEGNIWYDSANSKFKIYIEGVGFIPTASDITLVQYRNTVTLDSDINTPTNIKVNIGITEYEESDVLQVIYNGVVLTESIHYTLNKSNASISLIGFTSKVGDQVTFIDTKLIDTTTLTSISTQFSTHVNSVGNDTIKGHVNLTDTLSSTYNKDNGVAATPKLVYDATTLIDSVTNKKYRLSVSSGVLGIVEVS